MPPNAPFGQQYGQPGQMFPPRQQAPYGPPPAAATPYYGSAGPAPQQPAPQATPFNDPYAWQRQAKAGISQVAQQPASPAAFSQPAQPYGQSSWQTRAAVPGYSGYASPVPTVQFQPQAPSQPQPQVSFPGQPNAFGPQPGMNQFPAQQPPQYAGYASQPPRLSPFADKRKLYAGMVVLGVIVAISGITALANLGSSGGASSSIVSGDGEKVTPEQLFKNAVTNSLQVKSYTQKVTADGLQVERKVDVSSVKATHLSGSATISERNTVVDVYATVNDTYAKLIKSDLLTAKPTLQGVWLQARKNGKVLETPASSPSLFELQFTPATSLYDPFVIGNYEAADRQALQKIIDDQLVYRFDPSSVVQSTIDGQDASEFTVTVSASGRQALAAKAAELAGVPQDRITEAKLLSQLAGNANTRLTVAVSNKDQRIIQVKESGDKPKTTVYGSYDNTVPAQPPSSAAAWDAAFK